jgi:hypothetical protein
LQAASGAVALGDDDLIKNVLDIRQVGGEIGSHD